MSIKIGVIGCGNVGYAFLIWLHNKGFDVIGYDIDINAKYKIEKNIGNCHVANSIEDLSYCDSIFICVPTEPNEDGSADMSIYDSVINELSILLKNKENISIIQRSTCPPGSAEYYTKQFSNNISYAVNPSFLRKSSITYDTESPERIAIGGTGLAKQHLELIYKDINAPRYITENKTSVELLKYVENTIDAMLISYWNEILEYAKKILINPVEFVQLIEHIGDRSKFQTVSRVPGKAFGLWCLPKDLSALIFEMEKNGINCSLLNGIYRTNCKFEQSVGIGTIPAQSLWSLQKDGLKVLNEGYQQIIEYYNY